MVRKGPLTTAFAPSNAWEMPLRMCSAAGLDPARAWFGLEQVQAQIVSFTGMVSDTLFMRKTYALTNDYLLQAELAFSNVTTQALSLSNAFWLGRIALVPGVDARKDLRGCDLELLQEGAPRILRISAHAAPGSAQRITHILVYRNGQVLFHQPCTSAPQPTQSTELVLNETENSWYVVKVYGMPGPAPAATFDIAAHAHDCLATGATDYVGDNQVALTSPFYFRKEVTRPDPAPMPVPWPDADLQLDTLLRPCYSGAWRARWPYAQPGQAPWDAFGFEKLRDALAQAAE